MSDEINIETERKRLLWRAMHRGIKEMDIIVGGYAAAQLGTMNANEIREFAEILEIPDQDLLAWMTNQKPVPPDQQSPMLDAVLSYRPKA